MKSLPTSTLFEAPPEIPWGCDLAFCLMVAFAGEDEEDDTRFNHLEDLLRDLALQGEAKPGNLSLTAEGAPTPVSARENAGFFMSRIWPCLPLCGKPSDVLDRKEVFRVARKILLMCMDFDDPGHPDAMLRRAWEERQKTDLRINSSETCPCIQAIRKPLSRTERHGVKLAATLAAANNLSRADANDVKDSAVWKAVCRRLERRQLAFRANYHIESFMSESLRRALDAERVANGLPEASAVIRLGNAALKAFQDPLETFPPPEAAFDPDVVQVSTIVLAMVHDLNDGPGKRRRRRRRRRTRKK